MGSGGEPGMSLSDLQGPQLPPAAAAALRGQKSRPGRRLQGPAKDRERSVLGISLLPTLQVLPSFNPCFSLLQIKPPPRLLDATSFPKPVVVAEESLGHHRTGVSELNICKKERDTGSGWGIPIWELGKSCLLSRSLYFL